MVEQYIDPKSLAPWSGLFYAVTHGASFSSVVLNWGPEFTQDTFVRKKV